MYVFVTRPMMSQNTISAVLTGMTEQSVRLSNIATWEVTWWHKCVVMSI